MSLNYIGQGVPARQIIKKFVQPRQIYSHKRIDWHTCTTNVVAKDVRTQCNEEFFLHQTATAHNVYTDIYATYHLTKQFPLHSKLVILYATHQYKSA